MRQELLEAPCTGKPKTLRDMKMTKHAEARFAQRFPLLSMQDEWANAKRCGRRLVKRVQEESRRQISRNATLYQGPGGPIFVVLSQGEGRRPALVTVLPDPRYSTHNDMDP